MEFLCKSSFLEIYNEQVFDLLDTASCGLHILSAIIIIISMYRDSFIYVHTSSTDFHRNKTLI